MNFQQKYIKYKSKYIQLKDYLKGGACIPAPVPTDREYISFEEYINIPPARLETIGEHCYDIVNLANWIRHSIHSTYPANGMHMSLNDIWKVITAYNAYRIVDPALPNHFIYTPDQSAQIIAALNFPPVPVAITNLINTIKRGAAPLVPPLVPGVPRVGHRVATPAQIILFRGMIRVLPAALVPGTRYIIYHIRLDTYGRTDPFINIREDGFVTFRNHLGENTTNPAFFHFYNEADVVANGIPTHDLL